MPIVLATAGSTLLGIIVGIGLPILLGLLATKKLFSVNLKSGGRICRLRDLPWSVFSLGLLPLIGWGYYAMGFDEPNDSLYIFITLLVLPVVPGLIGVVRCLKAGKSDYILDAVVFSIFGVWSMFSVVPLTLKRRINHG